MPEDTRAFYRPWAGSGMALCPTLQEVFCSLIWIVLLLWSSTLITPALAGLSMTLLPPRLWERWAEQAEGHCFSDSHVHLKVMSKILQTVLLEPLFLLIASSFGVWFSGIPLCEWEHKLLHLLLGCKICQIIAMSHSSVEQGKEEYQIVLKLQGKVRKARWTPLSLKCTWDVCCQGCYML